MSRPAVYAFISVKGGVGKSALAVATAIGLARRSRRVAFVDADFAGTSIAENLMLAAPDLRGPEGAIRWAGQPGGWIEPKEAQYLLRETAWLGRRSALPTIDRLLLEGVRRFDPVAVAWHHGSEPTIRWYPSASSTLATDEMMQLVLGRRPSTFSTRIDRAFTTLCEGLGEDDALVVDLPPGMYGVATAIFRSLLRTVTNEHRIVPVVVTTPDRGDLFGSAEQFVRLNREYASSRWVINKVQRGLESYRRVVQEQTDRIHPGIGVDAFLEGVSASEYGLGGLFQRDDLGLDADVISNVLHAVGVK